ncbi:hypothetical protein L2E82_28229 [Cichorium intybus]|uniref:Uncharacterized protein n=1 Tax=Cichorium intybus TaxID=13427 RepID=A0ACB9CVI7_CICIN|nr:hypothetical protein L2E82_28229 [Cichorium intybus]
MHQKLDPPPRSKTSEDILLCSGTRVAANMLNGSDEVDYFDGVFCYLDKMLMEEDDLTKKPCMFIDSLALQATEKMFHDALVDNSPLVKETERLEVYDSAVLCEDVKNLWLDKAYFPVTFPGTTDGDVRKKRKKKVDDPMDLTEFLVQCAEQMASGYITNAFQILKKIQKHSSLHGSSSKRMAYYFANAIEARMSGLGLEKYRTFSSATISAAQILTSYKAYINACPFHRMSNIFANKSIAKLSNGFNT